MHVRTKESKDEGTSYEFVISPFTEVIVHFDDVDIEAPLVVDLEVYIEAEDQWMGMDKAFSKGYIAYANIFCEKTK